MTNISRSFYATEYMDGTKPSEFSKYEPRGQTHSVLHINKRKNNIHIIEHPSETIEDIKSKTESFDINIENWDDILRLSKLLKNFRDLPDDIATKMKIPAEKVKIEETKHFEKGIELSEELLKSIDIGVRISDGAIEFSVTPEPDNPIFPIIPTGDEFSLEGGATNQIHLNRFIEMIEISEEDLEIDSNTKKTIIDDELHRKLNDSKYGHEVIKHIQDGDVCVEKNLFHLALSSYIHAIEWAAITYLETEGKDIIQDERDGQLYYFASGTIIYCQNLEKLQR